MGPKCWLREYGWEAVVRQNLLLCAAKNALHKPTSDGYDATRELWEFHYRNPMGLMEAVELCRRCHRMAPFCFYNGNTFASIIRLVISRIPVSAAEAAAARSLAGHIVAGVASAEEERAFREFCERLGAGG
jgi:hypothetical protein